MDIADEIHPRTTSHLSIQALTTWMVHMWWDGTVFDANLLLKFSTGQGSLAGVGDYPPNSPPLKKRQVNNRGTCAFQTRSSLPLKKQLLVWIWPLPKHSNTMQQNHHPRINTAMWEKTKETHFMSVITICKENPTLSKLKKKGQKTSAWK